VACARRSGSYGAKVAVAESSRMGGTCVIRGCVPKKLMHYGAHFAEFFKASRHYGWSFGEPRLEFRRLLEARNKEIARLNGIYVKMLENAGVTIFPTRARVVGGPGPFTVEAGGERHAAERVVIAVGARPSLPEVPGIEYAVTSDEVLENVYDLPRRLIVVGAGYIGVELASIMSTFGADTSLVYRAEQPLRGFDDELRSELTAQLQLNGLKLRPSTRILSIERAGEATILHTDKGPLESDMLIYATGRKPIPNTRGLGLEDVGVRLDEEGKILVDRAYRSNVEGLFAVGDCTDHAACGLQPGQHDLTPVAIAEGRVIAETLYASNPHVVAYETTPTAIFGLPQGGSIGLGEARARAMGHDIAIYKTRFRPMLHALTGGDQKTFMKLVVDKPSNRVIGCHMVGDDAAEIIQGFAVAMTAGATKSHFDETVALHPTAAEEFVTMYQPAAD
jgi:glutathione reductase (NADPH)